MNRLTHFPLCPFSRSVRLALAECAVPFELAEERPWEWPASLLALNPAGELPVLQLAGGPTLCGAYPISEYLAEDLGPARDKRAISLLPSEREARAEVRRLVDWFHRKFDREVTRELMTERVYPCLSGNPVEAPPEVDVLRAIRANLRYHMSYLDHLADQRTWLAGEELTLADLTAAAHVSTADFLGEVSWEDHGAAKAWYQRVKSRPSFRPLLGDRVAKLRPPPHYADLDF